MLKVGTKILFYDQTSASKSAPNCCQHVSQHDCDELILLDAGPPLLCDGVCQWRRPHVPGRSELIEFHKRSNI